MTKFHEEKIENKRFTVNNVFDSVYVVNLDSRPDRYHLANLTLSKLNISFERFSGFF